MSAIPWSKFTKRELVEILSELEDCRYTVAELWTDCDVHYVSECSCEPVETPLPARVLEIRDRAVRRMVAPSLQNNPLRRWLASPFRQRA